MKKALKVGAWIVVVLVALLTVQVIRAGKSAPQAPEVSYSEFLSRVEAGQVSKVTIICNAVDAQDLKGAHIHSTAPSNQSEMLALLRQRGVEIWFRDAPSWPNWVLYLIVLVLLVWLWFVVTRHSRRIAKLEGSNKTLST